MRATPAPKWVVAVGDCGAGCGVFADSYACVGAVSKVIPVDLVIRGCPPTPTDLLQGLLALLSGGTLGRRERSSTHERLSRMSFLISTMARAGFKSLGHASVQFMIVWQRYRRNGSSSASSRSPLASSRLSMIQRYAARSAAGPRYRSLFHQ